MPPDPNGLFAATAEGPCAARGPSSGTSRAASLARGLSCVAVLVVSGAELLDLPAPLVAKLGAACGAAALFTVVAALRGRVPRPRLAFEPLLVAVSLCAVMLAVTAGTLAALPPPLLTATLLPLRHLGGVLVAQLLALVALFTWGALAPPEKGTLVEASLACVLVLATLNGELHGLLGTPRVPLLYGATVVAAAAVLGAGRPLRRPPAGLASAAVIFVFAAGVASIAGLDPQEGLVRTAALANWVAVAALLAAGLHGRREVRRLVAVTLAVGGALAAASLVSAIEAAAVLGPTPLLLQLGMAHTNANGAGLCAAVGLVLGFGLAPAWRRSRPARRLLALVMALLAGALVLSYSKAAACAFAAGGAVLLFHRRAARTRGRSWRDAVLAVALGTAALSSSLLQRDPHGAVATRLVLWKQAFRTIAARPLLGIGPGYAFSASYAGSIDPSDLSWVRSWFSRTHTHDLLLEVGVACGLVGLAAFLALNVLAARRLARSIRSGPRAARSLVLALAAALAAWWVDQLFVMVSSERSLVGESFWILLALALVAARSASDPVPGLRPPPHAASFGLALVALLAVVRPVTGERLRRCGEDAFARGLPATGRRCFAWAARLSPFDAALHDRWGVREGDPRRAAAPWRRAATLRPAWAPYQDRLGWLAWLEGDRRGARRFFTEAVRLDPEGIEGPYRAHLAYLSLHEGDRAGAVALLRASFRRDVRFVDPDDWRTAPQGTDLFLSPAYAPFSGGEDAKALRAAILRHLGLPDPAPAERASWEGAVRLEEIVLPTSDRNLLLQLREVYATHGLPERSARVADLLEAGVPPGEPLALWLRARRLQEQGRFAEAVEPISRLSAMSGRAQPRGRYVVALAAAGAAREAVAEARRLLRDPAGLGGTVSPLPSEEWRETSSALEKLGALDEARRAAEFAAFTSRDADSYEENAREALRLRLASAKAE